MAEIDASGLTDAVGGLSKRAARDVANRWFSRSQEILQEEGDAAGYNHSSVLQSGQPPQFDGESWRFGYGHTASVFFEFGTEPHTITPNQADMLVFEWEDAPAEVREMFSDTFPTVFFREVEVDGIDELRYVRDGRAQTVREVRNEGI